MIHTIFFDVGGTLVGGKSTLKVIADAMDMHQSDEIFKYLVNRFMMYYLDENPPRFYSIKELLTMTAKEAALQFSLDDISDRAVELYRYQHLEHDYLYDDTLPTLRKLKERNIKLILISDADSDVLIEQLKMYDILKYFDDVIISDQTQAYKPSDTVVNKALFFCEKPLERILFIGDRSVDIKTARKMGVKSALINRNGEFKYKADYHLKSLNDIFNIE
jgi:putative hydrolase of the HAD superfamily